MRNIDNLVIRTSTRKTRSRSLRSDSADFVRYPSCILTHHLKGEFCRETVSIDV